MTKKILYFDMDNVLVNFQSGLDQLSEEVLHNTKASSITYQVYFR